MFDGNNYLRTVIASLAFAAATAVGSATPPPIEAFAFEPEFESPVLSPDGRKVGFLTSREGKRIFAVLNLDTQDVNGVLAAEVDAFLLSWCQFKSNERLLCSYRSPVFEAGRPYWVSRLVSVDTNGGKSKVLIQNGRAGGSQFQDRILHWLPDSPTDVLIALDDDETIFPAAFRLNVVTGRMTRVLRDREPVMHWMADRKGVVRFGYGYREARGVYLSRKSEADDWEVLARFNRFDGEDFSPLGFGLLDDSLLIESVHNGRTAIFEMNVDDKSDRQLVFSRPDVDVGGPLRWPTDDRIVGFWYETDRVQKHFIEARAASIQRSIDEALPRSQNEVIDSSRDETRLLISATFDTKPHQYYVLDVTQRQLMLVSRSNSKLKQELAAHEPISIRTDEGIVLPGYLSVPPGAPRKNLPLVVYPHGGPHARDSWGYDEVVQFMVSRGYAVLQVNFRGSSGYGSDWYEAGLRRWGTVMHEDISAAVRWAVKEGIADPKRMCIVGWSYGGYAAFVGAVKEPDLYRCAVSIAGVSDMRALQNQQSRFYGGRAAAQYWIGSEDDELKFGSPIKGIASIRVPILLVHGSADIQVVVDHSTNMARALERANKPHELVIIKGGDHSLSRGPWRHTLLSKLEAFLGAHLGGAVTGPAKP